ncbi:MAG: glutamine--tRNA ligase/YqeY domain fusion protein [Christensenellaceae bacterium]
MSDMQHKVPEEVLGNPANFIEDFIEADLAEGKYQQIKTRFPPEPNGYLHIGHVKALWIDFGIAEKYNGTCNLRFDDTNPAKEEEEFVDAIMEDIHWLGYEWDKLLYGSQYFQECYDLAIKLIEKGVAYVDDLSREEMREYRGTLTTPGKNSPYRDRSVAENLDLFVRMKNGEFEEGSRTLRAKIDMASPNINMRDPALYRILYITHHQTGDDWCIYPMYDFAHPIQDAIEGISHSLCSLEYEAHRPLYDWVIEQCEFPFPRPRQIEFARLNMPNTVMSKRYLRQLVEEGYVDGWDDPRMPTLRGFRRRGYTPAAIKDFLTRVGVAKADSVVDTALLEYCIREELNLRAPRLMGVLKPLKLIIENYPEGQREMMTAEDLPGGEQTHEVPFSREIYIEQDDFLEERPNKKFFRLYVGGEVRLKNAYIIKCERVEKDAAGNIETVYCTYDPLSRSGDVNAGRKVKGTLHWVEQHAAIPAEYRIYKPLIDDEKEGDFVERINKDSKEVLHGFIEPEILKAEKEQHFQLMRQGYFCTDNVDFAKDNIVLNMTTGLRDSFKKAVKQG